MELTAAQLQQHNKLEKTARIWVAQTFFGEMLKQMRNSPFKSDMLDGGRGGQVFQGQLDQKLAERMAASHAGDRLVQSMVRRLEPKELYEAIRAHKLATRNKLAGASKSGNLIDLFDASGAATTGAH